MTNQDAQPFPVIDPAAPADLRSYIASASARGMLHRTTDEPTPDPSLLPAGLKFAGGTVLGVAVGGLGQLIPTTGIPDAGLQSLLNDLRYATSVGAMAIMLVTLWITVRTFLESKASDHQVQREWLAQQYVVLREDLSPHAASLVARARQAAEVVSATRVHADDLLDRQHNNIALPAQVWEIAQALTDHTRQTSDLPKNPATRELRQAAKDRTVLLEKARQAVAVRVEALEDYAKAAAEADQRYIAWLQMQELAASEADAHALLAATAGHELATAELQGMTSQADAVAEAFRTAVDGARSASLRALPPADAA